MTVGGVAGTTDAGAIAASVTPNAERLRSAAVDAALAVVLALTLAALLRSSLGLWWTDDDFFQVRWVGKHDAGEILASSAAWETLPMRLLTPLLFLSLRIDRVLFGLDAHAFRLHQLVAFGLAVAALYLVLRLWRRRSDAAAATLLAALGPAVTGLVPLLMVRHYLEGLTAALVAVGAWTLALRAPAVGRGRVFAGIAVLAYAAAAIAKEIFVPLPLLLVALPEATPRRRLRALVPYVAVAVAYVAYRRHLLGTLVGGYGWHVDPGELPRAVALLVPRLLRAAAAPDGPAAVAMVALAVAATAALAWRAPRLRTTVAATAVGVIAPLVPVATQVEPRWAALPWILLATAAAAMVSRLPTRARALAWSVALSLAALSHVRAWPALEAPLERASVEGMGFVDLGPGDVLAYPSLRPAAMNELAIFRTEELRRGPGAAWFVDDLYLCRRLDAGRRLWAWDATSGRLELQTDALRHRARRSCRDVRGSAPLEARFRWQGEALRWELGPRSDGSYALVFGDGVARVDVPRLGGYRLPPGDLALRVRWLAPAGWTTYSPPLAIPADRPLYWKRDMVPAGSRGVATTGSGSGEATAPPTTP